MTGLLNRYAHTYRRQEHARRRQPADDLLVGRGHLRADRLTTVHELRFEIDDLISQ